jgi:hypothetical protein
MAEDLLEGTLQYRDDEFADPNYKALAPSAIAGLLLGIASPLAFLHPLLLVVPAIAVGLCAVGLHRTSDPTTGRSGRRAAQFGLALALILGGGAAIHYVSHQYLARQEAEVVARQWFQYLAEGHPEKAHQLTLDARNRYPLDSPLWDAYRVSPELQSSLREFTGEYGPRALLWLGKDALVRPYAVEKQASSRQADSIDQVYAVTYEEDGRKKSFFISLTLLRTTDPVSGISSWSVNSSKCPHLPEAWPDPALQKAARKRR